MKKFALIALSAVVMLSFVGCANNGSFMSEEDIKDIEKPTGTIVIAYENENGREELTDSFGFELYYKAAPITVTNFVKLVKDGFYNDMLFHRIEQTSDADAPSLLYTGTYTDFVYDDDNNGIKSDLVEQSSVTYKIKGEFSENGWTNSTTDDVTYQTGTLAMTRGDEFDSASTGFHIATGTASSRNGNYAVFGRIILNSAKLKDFLGFATSTISNDDATYSNVPGGSYSGRMYIKSITINNVDAIYATLGDPMTIK